MIGIRRNIRRIYISFSREDDIKAAIIKNYILPEREIFAAFVMTWGNSIHGTPF